MTVTLEGEPGLTLLDCIRNASHFRTGIHLSAPCGGKGRCGKCKVRLSEERATDGSDGSCFTEPTQTETEVLSPLELSAGIRLACLTVCTARCTATVEIPEEDILGLSCDIRSFSPSAEPDTKTTGSSPLKVAADIGTSTIVCVLLDPPAGKVIGSEAEANRQRSWGSDVISRIEAAADPAVRQLMSRTVIQQIQVMMDRLLEKAGRTYKELSGIFACGNTTMLHLLLDCDPSGLGRLPFSPIFLEKRVIPAADAGFTAPGGCPLVLLPGISAFVGADISAGILATGIYNAEEPELLIDIGTNGEIVLAAEGSLTATATAAGPAFEGAHIACGVPGIPGALDHAEWDGKAFVYTTIGGKEPSGICGSGLLDILAAARLSGMLDETGRLDAPHGPDGMPRLTIVKERNLYITQADIRTLQLAKGAIAAGVRIVCRKRNINLSRIRKVHLAGGFGTFMKSESAVASGLLPAELSGKIIPAGNTALRGTIRIALAEDTIPAFEKAVFSATSIDLASEPGFQDEFMNSILFPDDETILSMTGGTSL